LETLSNNKSIASIDKIGTVGQHAIFQTVDRKMSKQEALTVERLKKAYKFDANQFQ